MKFLAEMKNHAQIEPQEGVYYLGHNDDDDDEGFVVLTWSNVFGWMTREGEPGVTDNVGVILPAQKH